MISCLERFPLPLSYINIYLFFLLILLDFIPCLTFNYSIWNSFGCMNWGKVLILNYFQPVISILFLSNPFFPYWMFSNVFNTWYILVPILLFWDFLSCPINLYFHSHFSTVLIGVTFNAIKSNRISLLKWFFFCFKCVSWSIQEVFLLEK